MKVLITGGAGFIGCNLADRYLTSGDDVVLFDFLARKGSERNLDWLKSKHKNINFVKGDICDSESVKKVVKDVDTIFHTAAQVTVTDSVKDPMKDFRVNILGTLNVLEAARQSKNDPTIIFTSTNKVYGDNVNGIPIKERETRYVFDDKKYENGIPPEFPIDAAGHSPYGVSKLAADQYIRDWSKTYDLKTTVFRMSCIYGTRQFGNEDQGWVAHFVISSFLNRPLVIFGDGKQVRDVLFIDDLVDAFGKAIENINKIKGKAYNIGGGSENTVSLLELLELLKKFGLNPEYTFGDWRPSDQKVYISDVRKATEFGWKPSVAPEDGIKRLLDWIKANRNLF